jgi:hypothetical protein
MAKFVTFDNGIGTYMFRAIFPSITTKKEIYASVKRKLIKVLNERGIDKEEFDFEDIKEFTTITNMKEGKIYLPSNGWAWDD